MRRQLRHRFRRGLRFALSRQANAYGFTLVVWGTGALAIWEDGKPDPAEVFAFLGGALVGASLLVAASLGVIEPFDEEEPPRRPLSAMHFLSSPSAAAAGWGAAAWLSGVAAYFVSALVAVLVYELALGIEVGFSLPRR